MEKPTRYPEHLVSGEPRELGRQVGEAAGEQVRGFCEIAMECVHKTTKISRERALVVARKAPSSPKAYSPDMVDEIEGNCGSGRCLTRRLDALASAQPTPIRLRRGLHRAFNANRLSIGTWFDRRANWDADPALDEFTIVLTRRPAEKPAFTTCTQAGLISYMGYNEAGIELA